MNNKLPLFFISTVFFLAHSAHAMEEAENLEERLKKFRFLKGLSLLGQRAVPTFNSLTLMGSKMILSKYPELSVAKQLLTLGLQGCCPLSCFFGANAADKYFDSKIKIINEELPKREVQVDVYAHLLDQNREKRIEGLRNRKTGKKYD